MSDILIIILAADPYVDAEGWAQIMKDGRAGIVPSNYLQAV